jgi:arylsulfatase
VSRAAGSWTALAALVLLCSAGCGAPPAPDRPNLLLISVDTLRADHLTCYGGSEGAGLCALADAGTRFEWAFATAPCTAPSVASILTSTYPSQHGVTQSALSFLEERTVTLAERLQEAGYTTAAFVSNPVLDRSRNLAQGFETWDQRMERRERNRPGFRDRDARSASDAALAWARVGAKPPWFLWMHYQDPHGPYDPPGAPPVRDAADAARLPVLDDHSGRGGIPAYQALPGVFSADAYRRAYDGEIRFLEKELTRLVAGLDALGAPPAVLLTADHGEALGEDDYWFAHGHSVGLDQIRVPLLWRPPRPAAPSVVDTPVGLIDVAPTLLRIAGLEVPAAFQGRPLPVAGAPSPDPGRPLFAEHELRAAVIAGRRYFARDTRPVADGERDPVSGGRVQALPPRTATLAAGGAAPEYRVEEEAPPALAELLEQHLARGPGARARRPGEVPETLRERLDALGYLE